jgi:hypothetical protein
MALPDEVQDDGEHTDGEGSDEGSGVVAQRVVGEEDEHDRRDGDRGERDRRVRAGVGPSSVVGEGDGDEDRERAAFAELKDPVRDRLRRYGIEDAIGRDQFFPTYGLSASIQGLRDDASHSSSSPKPKSSRAAAGSL